MYRLIIKGDISCPSISKGAIVVSKYKTVEEGIVADFCL
jgi:hypothetical protein